MVSYEVDFLAVGEGERSGDAIALRYGIDGDYTIHVVDGGDEAAGRALSVTSISIMDAHGLWTMLSSPTPTTTTAQGCVK
jgi:hypothetical protein